MDTLRLLSRSSGLKFKNSNTGTANNHKLLPSAGSDNLAHDAIKHDPNSKKRKRDDEDVDGDALNSMLNETQIRGIQKLHKIKITDLRALHRANKSDNRKSRKEESRIFPQPLQRFSQLKALGVNSSLIANIAEQAFKEPSEVQLATIPLLLRQEDEAPNILTVAPTGSGKTLAFLIPLINKISHAHRSNSVQDEGRHVSAIVLAPTKELVSQIVNEGRKLVTNTGVRIAELRKGMKLHEDHELANVSGSDDDASNDETTMTTSPVVKTDIIVSTPLSLVNTLRSDESTVLQPLPQIRTLILDEADVLLDPLFREQTLAIWSACASSNLQTSLWSATIGASVEELAMATIRSHRKADKTRSHRRLLLRTVIGLKDSSLPFITHRLTYASTEAGKLMGLRQLLHPAPQTSQVETPLRPPFIIFTQTISRAQALYTELQYDIPPSAGGSTRIAVLHSQLSSNQRTSTMASFRQGKIWILITTDLLSRGIDFRGVNGIVNYDIPTTAASYVHRAGRTGRAGRKGGIAVTFYTREDIAYLKPIANIIAASEKQNTTKVPDENNITPGQPTSSSSSGSTTTGLPAWLIPSLPHLTKSSRKDLKTRGVNERRAIKKSDDEKERRRKLKNRIGTKSGFERQLEHRKKGMILGSIHRSRRDGGGGAGDDGGDGGDDGDDGVFGGFGD